MQVGIIYCITNTVNGKEYVGQTIAPPVKRWCRHKYNAFKSKRHKKSAIYQAMRKYGIESFRFTILEENIERNKLNSRETFWISKLQTFENGYNLTTGGDSKTTINKETRNKMVQSSPTKICVYQYNPDGKLINSFPSIRQASKQTKITYSSIAGCLQNKPHRKTAGGYVWSKTKLNKRDVLMKIKGANIYSQKPVSQYLKNGEFVKSYGNIIAASEETGINSGSIGAVANKRPHRKSAGGYVWKFES